MAKGFDYAFGTHPSPAAIKAAGGSFVCRYISSFAPNDTNGKNLIKSEANSLLANGVSIVVVAEEGASRMLAGKSAGVADAQHADAVVKGLGMAGMPIYFACDFDATEGNQTAINAYLDGAASVIGRARVGLYGGYWPCVRAAKAGKATYFWQTLAWSGSNTPGNKSDLGGFTRNIYQQLGVKVGGISVDLDTSFTTDYGQFPRPGNGGDPVSHPTLTVGDTGDAVKEMQTRINVWDAAHPALSIDGDFGPSTLTGLKEFQKEHKLTVDGVCGPATWAALLVNPSSDPPAFHGEYVSMGMLSLNDLANSLGHYPSTLIYWTVQHYAGSWSHDLAMYINGVVSGEIPPTTLLPKGTTIWVA